MGILVCSYESKRIDIEEFCQMLLSCKVVHGTKIKYDHEFQNHVNLPFAIQEYNHEVEDKKVCVTGGVSYLGITIVNQLLLRGYTVRVIVQKQEDLEKLREMETSGEMRRSMNSVEAVMANLNHLESLTEAFNGCRGVFHTATFVDPAGLSGYSKSMAEIEVMVSKNVTKACAMTPSVRNCVLTSSLLACVWKDLSSSRTIDHDCWSDESICINKKLWYALGKLKAERVAWSIANDSELKLATICHGLITGPEFLSRNPTSTIAYLKGAEEMFRKGLLATVDVNKLAIAHVTVFEEMKNTASGRYICFDRVIRSEEEFEKLASETGIEIGTMRANSTIRPRNGIKLSNAKLYRLMSATYRCNSEC